MQYLHLVYLAEQRLESISAPEKAAACGPPFETAPAEPDTGGASPCAGGAFFTDGPFLETKEYLTAS
jgi:hypothetical protein